MQHSEHLNSIWLLFHPVSDAVLKSLVSLRALSETRKCKASKSALLVFGVFSPIMGNSH